jgi:hypothetical protein
VITIDWKSGSLAISSQSKRKKTKQTDRIATAASTTSMFLCGSLWATISYTLTRKK